MTCVLVFVEDPGAANGMVRIPAALRERNISVHVVATGAAERFLAGKVAAVESLRECSDARELLGRHRASAVLVGTSENPATFGLSLIDAARTLALPSVAFVDAFPNAPYRFRGTTSDPLAHSPDIILVPDVRTRDAFVGLGAAPERVILAGHPLYDDVLAAGASLRGWDRAALREKVFRRARRDLHTRVVTFAAEISTGFDHGQFQRSPSYTLHGRGRRHGRTEIVLEELVDAVGMLSPRPHLVLRLHPKNTQEEFGRLLDDVDEVSQGGAALDVVYASDLVVGMTSTILVEASLLGRPTLSIVPRRLEVAWLPAILQGITPCATTREEITRELGAWAENPLARAPPPVSPGAVDRIVDVLTCCVRENIS